MKKQVRVFCRWGPVMGRKVMELWDCWLFFEKVEGFMPPPLSLIAATPNHHESQFHMLIHDVNS